MDLKLKEATFAADFGNNTSVTNFSSGNSSSTANMQSFELKVPYIKPMDEIDFNGEAILRQAFSSCFYSWEIIIRTCNA